MVNVTNKQEVNQLRYISLSSIECPVKELPKLVSKIKKRITTTERQIMSLLGSFKDNLEGTLGSPFAQKACKNDSFTELLSF